jgi:hypothetical protein
MEAVQPLTEEQNMDSNRKSNEEEEKEEEEEEEEAEVEIDWKQEEGLINSYRLNDSEVAEALELLEEAKKWTALNSQEVTQRIRLIAKDGSVLHVIRNKTGKPDTKDIKIAVAAGVAAAKAISSLEDWDVAKFFEQIFDFKWISMMFYEFYLRVMKSFNKYFAL